MNATGKPENSRTANVANMTIGRKSWMVQSSSSCSSGVIPRIEIYAKPTTAKRVRPMVRPAFRTNAPKIALLLTALRIASIRRLLKWGRYTWAFRVSHGREAAGALRGLRPHFSRHTKRRHLLDDYSRYVGFSACAAPHFA